MKRGPYHKGWVAVGFSPDRLAKAKAEHEAEIERAQAAGDRVPPPWDEQTYMRRAKPDPVRIRPCDVQSAATELVRIAERCGWRGCYVQTLSSSVK